MPDRVSVRTSRFGRVAELGPYTQAFAVPPGRGLLYTTGIIGRDDEGKIVEPYDAEAQTRRILENMKALLAEVGCTLDDVIKVTVYLCDMDKDLAVVRDVRNEYWPVTAPVSTGVQVARLITDDVRVEIEAVALLPEGYWDERPA